jgi:excisionase family DNA binding protein
MELWKGRSALTSLDGEMKSSGRCQGNNGMDLLTVKEAAALSKLSCSAVYALCNAGIIPHLKLGKGRGAIRIDRGDLLRYLDGCKAGSDHLKATSTPPICQASPGHALRVNGFKHLRVDRLLSRQPHAGDPSSYRGGRSAP